MAPVTHLCVTVGCPSTAAQRVEEAGERSVPSVRVVQVTRVTGSFHHHHAVIGQISQVVQRPLCQLRVLVAVDDERRHLEKRRDTKAHTNVRDLCDDTFSESFLSRVFF